MVYGRRIRREGLRLKGCFERYKNNGKDRDVME
jgi:hypothetical protein